MVQEMLAYMLIVWRAQHEYQELVWRLYDEAFWDKAAAMRNQNGLRLKHTSTIKYSQAGQGRGCCALTAVLQHEECPTVQPRRKRQVEEAKFGRLEEIPKRRKGICWDFNNGACRFGDKCRFCHICSEYAGHHPTVSCRSTSVPKKGLTLLAGGPLLGREC